MLSRRSVTGVLGLLVAACAQIPDYAGPAKTLLLESALPESAAPTRAAGFFAEEAGRRSGGRVFVKIVAPPADRGWPRNLVPLVVEGKIDLALSYYNWVGFSEGQAGTLPGLINDRGQAGRFPGSPLAASLAARLEARGATSLCWIVEKNVIASRVGPMRLPGDASGQKFRAIGPYVDLLRQVGGFGVALPLSESWPALQRGLYEAAFVPAWMMSEEFGAARAAQNVVVPEADAGFYSLMSIMISAKAYGGLDPDLQRLLVDSGIAAQRRATEELAELDRLALATFTAQGKSVVAISGLEFAAWSSLARNRVWEPLFVRLGYDANLVQALREFR